MKLRNISKSKYEFSVKKEGENKPTTISVLPGSEIEIDDEVHPESMKLLAVNYPKDWVEVTEKKKSVAELEAELKKRKDEEAASKKAEADAKAKEKADSDAKAKEKAEAKAKAEADAKAKADAEALNTSKQK